MKTYVSFFLGVFLMGTAVNCQNNSKANAMNTSTNIKSIYDFNVEDSKGAVVKMADFKGKTLLIVNVASKCGYTKQYTPLEALFEKYSSKDFVILGFPCNQFGGQEPGTNQEILSFCELTYGVKFPIFSKLNVNGSEAHPLYVWLKDQTGGGAIKWNFNKFLVDKNGKIVKRYDSGDSLEALEKDVIGIL